MIEEIEKELKEGRKVKVERRDANKFMVDESKFKRDLYLKKLNADGEVVLTRTATTGFAIDNSKYQIPFSEMHHFKIKKSDPTFDDLIDVVVKAVKDEVAVITNLKSDYIEINNVYGELYGRSFYSTDGVEAVKKAIDWIDLLYTETFVIESEEDTLKIDTSGDEIIKVVLANNEVLSSNYLDCLCDISDGFRFKILKGATVTQERGKR